VLRDGKVVVNEDSLTIAPAAPRFDPAQYTNTLDATDAHITSATYMKRVAAIRWTPDENKLFFKVRPFCFLLRVVAALFGFVFRPFECTVQISASSKGCFQTVSAAMYAAHRVFVVSNNSDRNVLLCVSQIRNKYKKEERDNPALVRYALTHHLDIGTSLHRALVLSLSL
jgi:hypothetical protein